MNGAERAPTRILVHAPIGRDGPASAELLRKAGFEAEVCREIDDLAREIEVGAGAVFIAEEGLFTQGLPRLAKWVSAQPPWSDLPFVVLTSRHEHASVVAWRERLSSALGNVSMLERPIHPITLTSAMRSAVRARTRQYEVRQLIEARDRAAQNLEAQIDLRTGELASANAELVKQIAEREKFEAVLRQAQKVEAIGQLTGGVAHDFNNLLMVISGGLSLLEKPQSDERRRRLMDGMRDATERGAGLSRQLLAFARRKSLTAQSVDLVQQIEGMRELLDRTLRGDVHVETDFAIDLWPTEVDPDELQLVLLNLCVNARDAMPTGGTITIRAKNTDRAGHVELPGEFISLSVSDTGTGMPPEVKAKVFEPFFTTKDIGKGSGLGLPQVLGFAQQSKGSVTVESEVGSGTIITLLLPRATHAPAAGEHHLIDLAPRPGMQGSTGSVLLVEDDDEVAALVVDMLEQIDWRVTRVSAPDAALGALANARPVDLVFSDIMMPGTMNGVDLAREIRRRRPELPIVLTSGYAGAAALDAQALGIEILAKPYQLADLEEMLSRTMSTSESSEHGLSQSAEGAN